MPRLLSKLFLLPLCAVPALADHLGGSYPHPVDLTSNQSAIPAAWEEITSTLQDHLDAAGSNKTFGGVLGLENVTFSIGLFSLNDPDVSDLQFHYTSPEVSQSPNGTNEVDGDTIYLLASITKVFTVLTGMLQLNDTDWDLRVTDLFPEIAELARKTSEDNPVDTFNWDSITLNTLSSQISGIPTNPLLLDLLLSYLSGGIDPTTEGFPPYSSLLTDPRANATCLELSNTTCYLPQIAPQYPNFLPWESPIYSNNNFILLTALMENITGSNMPSMVEKSILEPLDMSSSYSGLVPPSEWDHTVIIDPQEFTIPIGLSVGSGGVASTLNDLSKFGNGILSSALMSRVETRRWMKPVTHTGRFQFSFGRPWEILRYTHASGSVTDLYTKGGDSGSASTYLVLIPDYNVGFTILGSSSIPERNPLIGRIGDLVGNTLLPALEAQAAAEAASNFAGRYESNIDGYNTSLVLSVDQSKRASPGLLIDSFVVNGTDVIESQPFYFAPGARLVPSISSPSNGLMAFRVATAADAPSVDISDTLFSGSALGDYIVGDALGYGGVSLSLFVFDVNEDGCATAVEAAAWRARLRKVD